jgi:hypothetical protein
MADSFSTDLKGLKEVDENLTRLGAVAGEKVMRSVLFQSAKPILTQAVQNIAAIQGGSGALAKATRRVYMKSARSSSSGSRFTVAVAPKVRDRTAIALANLHYKPRKPIRGIFWGHLVEWGFNHRGGRRVAGKLVFTRALQSSASQAIEAFRQKIFPAVERALKKLNTV